MAIIEGTYSFEETDASSVGASGAPPEPISPSAHLRRRLVAFDLTAVVTAWTLAYAVDVERTYATAPALLTLLMVVVVTMGAIHHQRLYQSRVAAIRSEEVARIGRASCVAAVAATIVGELVGVRLGPPMVVTGVTASFVLLTFGRGRYRSWITARRSDGHFTRRVVVVGDSHEAASLIELFQDSPELGILPVGFAGALDLDRSAPPIPCLGGCHDVEAAVAASGAGGVVICASSMSSEALNDLVRRLHQAGIHVLLSTGITGMHRRRLRVQPVSYEPLIYVEPASLSRLQVAVKRAMDITGSIVGLVVAAPVLLAAAIAIKVSDGGPVLFRQERVGVDGRLFTILKLRTMCVDAEARFAEVEARNERNGPIFKLEDDPRITKVGGLLRTSSIDELPQLLNVLQGAMSLVGPRPALPSEVAGFDRRLIDRLLVKPGMTGLWQVEARDNPSFGAYRRLDLFYVENWSVTLDAAILLKTGSAVFRKLRQSTVRAHDPSSTLVVTKLASTDAPFPVGAMGEVID